jgi:energy-converting hydrogenase Eha subunit A
LPAGRIPAFINLQILSATRNQSFLPPKNKIMNDFMTSSIFALGVMCYGVIVIAVYQLFGFYPMLALDVLMGIVIGIYTYLI